MICDRCDCRDECEYFEETIKPIKSAVIFPDEFTTAIANILQNFNCEYFEEINT